MPDIKSVYDKDIQDLLSSSKRAKRLAKEKEEQAERIIAKRYGHLGLAFARALGLDATTLPKKQAEINALVNSVMAAYQKEAVQEEVSIEEPEPPAPSQQQNQPKTEPQTPRQQQRQPSQGSVIDSLIPDTDPFTSSTV